MNQEKNKQLIEKADLKATNDLRKAIYNCEFKTLYTLQVLSIAGIGILVNFFLMLKCNYNYLIKGLFWLAIFCFIVALSCSIKLRLIYPDYLDARWKQPNDMQRYNLLCKDRKYYFNYFFIFFIIATALSMIGLGWLIIGN